MEKKTITMKKMTYLLVNYRRDGSLEGGLLIDL